MAADGVPASVRGSSGDPQPEWWEAFRDLEEKMQDGMRLQKEEMHAALDQMEQETNRKIEEVEKRLEQKLKGLEERVAALEGRRAPSGARGSAGGPGVEGTVHLAMDVTPTYATVQRMSEFVGQRGGALETLLVSADGTGGQAETEVEQELLSQQEESLNQAAESLYPNAFSMEAQLERVHVSVGRREGEKLEAHVAEEEPVQQAHQSASHRRSVPGSAMQLPVFTAGQRESGRAQALFVQSEGSMQAVPQAAGPSGNALQSPLERIPVTGGNGEVVHMSQQEEHTRNSSDSVSQHKTVSVSPQQLHVFTAEEVEAAIDQARKVQQEGSVQGPIGTVRPRRSDWESLLGMIHVAQEHGDVYHLEHMTQQGELMNQTPESMSHQSSVLVPQSQIRVLAPRQGEAGLAEWSALAAPESAGPSGGPSELYQDRRHSEAPPARRTSRPSSSPPFISIHSARNISAPASVSLSLMTPEEQNPSHGVSPAHPGPQLRDLGEALVQAARVGCEEEVRALLLAGAEVNCVDEMEKTPLMLAAWNGHLSLVQLLLGSGADVNAVTRTGLTPLHFAAAYDQTGQCVSMLLNAGANREGRNDCGRTPLHLAAFWDNVTAAKELIKGGTSKTSTDNTGKTPYDYTKSERLRNLLRP